MNVEKFTMKREDAAVKLREVREALRHRADKEYQGLERAYKQVAKGRAVLNLRDAILNSPTFDNGLPKLAIARADRPRVHVERAYRNLTFRDPDWRLRSASLRFNFDGLPYSEKRIDGDTLVPIIPPAVRKIAGFRRRLDKMFVLWEVEEWRLVPPVDPYLLAHIGGDLYAVLAAWDLTPIERAVMAGRARA